MMYLTLCEKPSRLFSMSKSSLARWVWARALSSRARRCSSSASSFCRRPSSFIWQPLREFCSESRFSSIPSSSSPQSESSRRIFAIFSSLTTAPSLRDSSPRDRLVDQRAARRGGELDLVDALGQAEAALLERVDLPAAVLLHFSQRRQFPLDLLMPAVQVVKALPAFCDLRLKGMYPFVEIAVRRVRLLQLGPDALDRRVVVRHIVAQDGDLRPALRRELLDLPDAPAPRVDLDRERLHLREERVDLPLDAVELRLDAVVLVAAEQDLVLLLPQHRPGFVERQHPEGDFQRLLLPAYSRNCAAFSDCARSGSTRLSSSSRMSRRRRRFSSAASRRRWASSLR